MLKHVSLLPCTSMRKGMTDFTSILTALLGTGIPGEELSPLQMSLRAVVVFSAAIVMIRIGHKRFMGKNTSLDVLLGIIVGSVLSRAITGNAPLIPTLAAGFALVLFHWLLSAASFRFSRLRWLVSGKERCLIERGAIHPEALHRSHITRDDLLEALRNNGIQPDTNCIETACLERNGSISIIPKTSARRSADDE